MGETEDTKIVKGPLIARGRTAEMYAYGDRQVLKLFYDWCPPGWIEREITANAELADGILKIPRLYGTIEEGGRRGLIYERVQGQSMLKQLSDQPWRFINFAHQFASLHAETHNITAHRLPDIRDGLRQTIEKVDILSPAKKESVLKRLERLPDGDRLCHFDFHPDQIIMTFSGPVVIDWMTAFRGSPAADVARTSIILLFSHAPYMTGFKAAMLSFGQRFFYQIYRRRYLILNPSVSEAAVQAWMLPVAVGRLRENIAGEENQLLSFISKELGKNQD